MTSYLRSWLSAPVSTPTPPSINTIPPNDDGEDDDGSATETEQDDDAPPAFPSPFSAQRLKSGSGLTFSPTPSATRTKGILDPTLDSRLMPPPPLPSLAVRTPGVVPSANLLALPPSTTKAPTKLPTLSDDSEESTSKTKKKRAKVALAPGHSALDWASLKASGADLRGVDTLLRVPPSLLKQHNKRDDAWSAFNGKVYNITPYLPFHPGGEKELMRVAGRDGTKLFASTHGWVNVDFMLDSSLVGFLVAEPSS